MRFVYDEGDLIGVSKGKPVHHALVRPNKCGCPVLMPLQAEVQQLHADGSIVLHTRSQKYGKVSNPWQPSVPHHARHAVSQLSDLPLPVLQLEGGQLLTVPANLIKRQKQHFHHLEELGTDGPPSSI